MPTYERIVYIPDLHDGDQDNRAIELAIKIIRYLKPDRIIQLGDFVDFLGLSSFEAGVSSPSMAIQRELDIAHDILDAIRSASPKSSKQMIEGNHEYRLARWLSRHPEFQKLNALRIEGLLKLKEYGWDDHLYKRILLNSGEFIVKHGDYVAQDAGQSAKKELMTSLTSGISGHCFSDSTELLGKAGWLGVKDIEVGTQVATLNKTTNTMEFQPVEQVFQYSHYTELIRTSNTATTIEVTSDHGLIAYDGTEGKASEFFGKKTRFRLAAVDNETTDDEQITDSRIRAIAWIMSEGSIRYRTSLTTGLPLPQIRIFQSDRGDNLAALEKDLTDAGFEFSKSLEVNVRDKVHRNFPAYCYNILDTKSHAWVFDYIGYDKLPQEKLWKLSSRQALVFLNAYCDGDGYRPAQTQMQIVSKDVEIIDMLQSFACRNGMRTSVTHRQVSSFAPAHKYYYLAINTRDFSTVSAKKWSRIPYSGNVWCVSVENGTLVTRNNGHTTITLNTHRMGQYSYRSNGGLLQWTEAGCLQNNAPSWKDSVQNWQHGIAIGEHEENGNAFSVTPVPFRLSYKATVLGKEIS